MLQCIGKRIGILDAEDLGRLDVAIAFVMGLADQRLSHLKNQIMLGAHPSEESFGTCTCTEDNLVIRRHTLLLRDAQRAIESGS